MMLGSEDLSLRSGGAVATIVPPNPREKEREDDLLSITENKLL